MMECTVQTILECLNEIAPFDTAEPWDNVGLLIGKKEQPVERILTALDATPDVIEEASRIGAQLIVTHHPLMFHPIRRLDEEEPEARILCSLIRRNLSLIACHTNFDKAPGGVNDSLAEKLGWKADRREGFLLLGSLESAPFESVRQEVQNRLQTHVSGYGSAQRCVSRFAVCSGACGDEEIRAAAREETQVLLTGEMKHNQLLDAMTLGMNVLCAGHYGTEICAANSLAKHLQNALNRVQLNVNVFASTSNPFA